MPITLNSNEIFASLSNMIISIETFADNIKGSDLVDKARVDGTLYGDTKLYYSTDVLESHEWGADSEATNLLALARPKAPEQQAIVFDIFRQIRLTVDYYLTKRAFFKEGSFSEFQSVMLSWIRNTKKVYDGTLYNAFVGTVRGSSNKATKSIDLDADSNSAGENIALGMANLFAEMTDYNRDFNDYKQLRRYSESEIKVVWNSKYINAVKKIDLPSIFHNEELLKTFEGDVLNYRYFGDVITSTNVSNYSASTPTTGKPINSGTGAYTPGSNNANGTVRSMIEITVTVSAVDYHVFPGDEIPAGATIGASGTNFLYGEVYIEQADIIAQVFVKLPPYMSAFEASTDFFNPRSLTETHYLTFGHNTLQYLKGYPVVTVKAE